MIAPAEGSAREARTVRFDGEHYRELDATGLRGWFRVFMRRPSPKILLALFAAAVIARVPMSGWGVWDAVIMAAFVLVQPFTEWSIHVTVLHFRPRLVAGRRVDPYVSRKHREHHLDPDHIDLVFIQLPTLALLLLTVAILDLVITRDLRLWLSAMVIGLALTSVYEWTHFLIHSPYVPRSRLYRSIWRSHRLHHFKNENYWFGITSHLGDRVLRTYPEKSAVPSSPTARTLGIEIS